MWDHNQQLCIRAGLLLFTPGLSKVKLSKYVILQSLKFNTIEMFSKD